MFDLLPSIPQRVAHSQWIREACLATYADSLAKCHQVLDGHVPNKFFRLPTSKDDHPYVRVTLQGIHDPAQLHEHVKVYESLVRIREPDDCNLILDFKFNFTHGCLLYFQWMFESNRFQ
ncbi:hypothetical protein D9M71_577370 [compost metagenome]